MNLREEIIKLKVNSLIMDERKYSFPIFIRLVRNALGVSRKSVAENMGVSQTKLYYLESGKHQRAPQSDCLNFLSEFYGIERDLLLRKFNEFMKSNKKQKSGAK